MDDKPIGRVTHYYDKIGVAIVKLEKPLKVGEKIKFMKGEDSVEQVVESMQVEHEPVSEGTKGQEVGIKVGQKVKDGTLVYLV